MVAAPLSMPDERVAQRRRLLFNVNVAWFFISHRLPIARAARDAGFDVHVAADIESEDEAALISQEGMTFHRVPLSRGSLNFSRDLAYMAHVGAVIRRVRPHLVHNVTVKPVIYGSVAARLLGVPRIVNAISGLGYAFVGGSSRRLLSKMVKTAYRLALRDSHIRVIFQNEDDMRAFLDARIVERSQTVLIRGSGVDTNAFARTAEPSGVTRIVLPARMLRDKGVVEFAEAAKLLLSEGCAASFILAGMTDDANRAALSREELAALERRTGVSWIGHVSDMPALFAGAHVICLPSYREGLPKALIEACAAARPIVTTDVPGCRDVVRDGFNGLLVKPRDAASLARALRQLIDDPGLRAQMGAAGRRRAEEEFDLATIVGATLALYREISR